MIDRRPKNLNLFTIHFPLPAIVSILHRISGFILFLMIPLALWALDLSFTADGFKSIQSIFNHFYYKLIVWAVLSAFCFHMVAGIRHLLSDLHLGDTLKAGRVSAWLSLILSAVIIIFIGYKLW